VDVEGIDISSAISGILTDMATKATRGADYRVYTRDMNKIEELEVPSSLLPEAVATLEDQTRHMVAPMQKNIERMMASKSQVLKVPGFRSGRLHSAGLHRLATKDDRIFRRRHETTSKETAVTLLIDNSGSMRQGVRSKDGSYKTKIEVAMAAGYALSQTLERVGIKHEVIGFTTKELKRGSKYLEDLEAEEARIGRGFSRMEPLHMPIFKGFDERLTPETKKRFTMPMNGMPLLNNIDGESQRVAALRLVKRSEKRKVIIVLSDGNPACSTRHPGEINSDLHRAVAECGKMHIDLVGLGIMDVSVREFYPRCVVLNDLADLPGAVMGELKRILTAA
jgi:cobalamin biosynthesis protein CobT